jgi:integrin beta 8
LGATAPVAAADGVAALAVLPRRAVPDRFGFAALVPSDDALAGDAAPAVFVLDAVRRARGLRAGVSAVSAAAVPAAVSAGAGAVALDALAPVEAVAAVVLSVVAGSAGWAGAAGAAGAAAGPPGSVASPAAGSADPPGPDGLGAPEAGAGARMDSGSLIATVGASGPDASGAGPPGASGPDDSGASPPGAGACMDSGSLIATVGASGPDASGAGTPAAAAAAAAAAAFATSRVRAAPARPRPIRSGRVEGSAPSTLFSVFFGFAGFFFCLSGFSAIRCECTVQSGHGARSPSDTGQETTICVPASYAVVAGRAIDDPKPNS